MGNAGWFGDCGESFQKALGNRMNEHLFQIPVFEAVNARRYLYGRVTVVGTQSGCASTSLVER